jgi:hypothetical protein
MVAGQPGNRRQSHDRQGRAQPVPVADAAARRFPVIVEGDLPTSFEIPARAC